MTDILPETQSSSGLILKAAREELSLTLEQVANELHLRPSVVKSIEDEKYDDFSSDVFLKGYFRTYCRLVNLHESRMMELLDQQLLIRQKLVEEKENSTIKLMNAQKRKKVFISSFIFVICVFLVALTYHLATNNSEIIPGTMSDSESNLDPDTEVNILPSSEEETAKITSGDDENKLNTPSELKQEQELKQEDVDNTSTENTSTNQETEVLEELPEEPNYNLADEVSIIEQETEVNLPLNEELENSSFTATLKARFTGDCWFKLTDSTGKTVIADLKKENDEINFSGSAPFDVVIGDASKIALFFEEKLVDLKLYASRNGYAKFTLKPSESNNEG